MSLDANLVIVLSQITLSMKSDGLLRLFSVDACFPTSISIADLHCFNCLLC